MENFPQWKNKKIRWIVREFFYSKPANLIKTLDFRKWSNFKRSCWPRLKRLWRYICTIPFTMEEFKYFQVFWERREEVYTQREGFYVSKKTFDNFFLDNSDMSLKFWAGIATWSLLSFYLYSKFWIDVPTWSGRIFCLSFLGFKIVDSWKSFWWS